MFSRSGNNWTNGANLGAFYRNANYVASDSNRNYCARISSIKHAHRAHGSVPLGKNRPIRRGLVGKPKTG